MEACAIALASLPQGRGLLVRLAAQETRPRGCIVLVAMHEGDPAALPLLGAGGDVELDGDLAWTDTFDSRLTMFDPATQRVSVLESAAFETWPPSKHFRAPTAAPPANSCEQNKGRLRVAIRGRPAALRYLNRIYHLPGCDSNRCRVGQGSELGLTGFRVAERLNPWGS